MPSGAVAAIGGGIAGSIFGAKESADAAESASRTQARAADAAINEARDAREQSVELRKPFTEFGTNLVPELKNRLTNPTTRSDIVNNDLYQSLFGNAVRTIRASNAGGKGVDSGQTLTDLTNASLGIGSQIHQQDINNLFQAVNLGSNSASGAGNTITNSAANVGNLLTQQGNVLAAGRIGKANATNDGVNNLISIGRYALENN
jgi:hypothetical protein